MSTLAVLAGLMDVAVHPRYAENKLIYFTYSKPAPGPRDDIVWSGNQKTKGRPRAVVKATLARDRFDGGTALTDVRDLLVADAESQVPPVPESCSPKTARLS